jgi:hypothetical protein
MLAFHDGNPLSRRALLRVRITRGLPREVLKWRVGADPRAGVRRTGGSALAVLGPARKNADFPLLGHGRGR